MPGPDARAALEAAVVRMGRVMEPQHVSNIWWAIAKLGFKVHTPPRGGSWKPMNLFSSGEVVNAA
jgi:hypothetical protein